MEQIDVDLMLDNDIAEIFECNISTVVRNLKKYKSESMLEGEVKLTPPNLIIDFNLCR